MVLSMHKDSSKQLDSSKYVRYTPEQVEALERVFMECPKPSSIRWQRLIRECPILSNIESKKIKVWFQNRSDLFLHGASCFLFWQWPSNIWLVDWLPLRKTSVHQTYLFLTTLPLKKTGAPFSGHLLRSQHEFDRLSSPDVVALFCSISVTGNRKRRSLETSIWFLWSSENRTRNSSSFLFSSFCWLFQLVELCTGSSIPSSSTSNEQMILTSGFQYNLGGFKVRVGKIVVPQRKF
ncbi:hypothetical protein MRB53_002350 [Persea americana]|uniref:Uncharacterized protein n=1 Tax=Persea americana TaxID=3435 RepID=A0ACC2MU91_PERAE|nr:hypothetical protein MRB53_002350 [Persea americana]